MAGQARQRAIEAYLEAKARDVFELEPTDKADHLAYVCYQIENGITLKALAEAVQARLGFEVSASMLRRHIARRYGSEETDAALDEARARASHTLADESLAIVDAEALTPQEVSRAASRARSRQWLAERYNPAKYGNTKQTNVSISIGGMHLDALRARTVKATAVVSGNDHVTSALALGAGDTERGIAKSATPNELGTQQ